MTCSGIRRGFHREEQSFMGFVKGVLERAEWRPNEISLSNLGACNDL